MPGGRTMFEKIWSRHVVTEGPGGQTLLYIGRHLLHEGSTFAFARLRQSGRGVRRPQAMVATADHYVPTANRGAPSAPRAAGCRDDGRPRAADRCREA